MKVCWLSAGVSSFIAGYLSKDVDKFIYIDIADQHPDSMRFIKDCEKALNKPVQILRSEQYSSVEEVCLAFRFVASAHGAKCTEVLKKRVRKKWEYEHRNDDITYIWGLDCTEARRAERLTESMPNFQHEFPLIEHNLTKQSAHAICQQLGVRRPAMYDMGYQNNNCIGCIKGGMGYWNKIRVDFPNVFSSRAKMEREIGHSILNGVYLDDLDPKSGRMQEEIMPDCDIFCYLTTINRKERLSD